MPGPQPSDPQFSTWAGVRLGDLLAQCPGQAGLVFALSLFWFLFCLFVVLGKCSATTPVLA